MTTYGLTTEGFVAKPLLVCKAELEAVWRAVFGDEVPVHAKSANGQLIGILAEREALLWELGRATHGYIDPDNAVRAGLDAVCGITGTIRLSASSSTVTGTLTGVPTSPVAAGSRASTTTTEVAFDTTEAATIALLTTWTTAQTWVIGNRVTYGGNAYECTVGGVGIVAPTGTGTSFEFSGVTWRYLGLGTGAVDVEFASVDTGPRVAVAFSMVTIETPVAGWQGVINMLDADLGRLDEEDPDLRIRREDELSSGDVATHDAIRAGILAVEDVTACRVFRNPTAYTDADGVPQHALEILVRGGDDQDIFDAVLALVADGIETYGTEEGTAEDDEGEDQPVAFTRATEVPIHIIVHVTYDADLYPAGGSDLIKAAIVLFGDRSTFAKNAVSAAIGAQSFTVAGVIDAPLCYIGTSASPTLETTIAIGARQIATYDTGRITVVATPGTP